MKKNIDKKKRKVKKEKNKDTNWLFTIFILTFTISIIMGLFSEVVLKHVGIVLAVIITLLFIGLGIFFDMIGVSVTAGNIKVFNSMSSKKVKGSKISVWMIKNNSKVSSVCCDVIGDICGVLSGGAGVVICSILVTKYNFSAIVTSVLTTAFISMLTIGGKAIGKIFAIKKSTYIINKVSKFLYVLKRS